MSVATKNANAKMIAALDASTEAMVTVEKRKTVDLERLAKFSSIGFFIGGPGLRWWYGVLDKVIKGPNKSILVLKKVGLDQFVFAPLFLVGTITN